MAKGDMAAAIDHILPVAQGGANTIDNLQIAHRRCNSMKCDRIGFQCLPVGQEGDRQLTFPGFLN